MRWFSILLLSALVVCGAPSFTEFYVQTTGANTNSGHTTDNGPTYTSVNGNWNGTSVFTPVDGSTPASTVTNGAWASVYNDGANPTVYVALVTNVAAGANGAITLSQANFAGTKPTSSANGRTINIGGAWKGPTGSVGFPLGFAANTLTNLAGNCPCVNIKSGTSYLPTSGTTHALPGPLIFAGYLNNPRDRLGIAKIDANNSTITIVTFSSAANDVTLMDIEFCSNGSGSSDLVYFNGCNYVTVLGCIFRDAGRVALRVAGSYSSFVECEVYGGNKGNNSNFAPVQISGTGDSLIRLYSHDNIAGANCDGILISGAGHSLVSCIFEGNAGSGAKVGNSVGIPIIKNCDFYNNTKSGIDIFSTATFGFYAENCNFVKNGDYGITTSAYSIMNGAVVNCAFGSGTMTNTLGNFGTNIIGTGSSILQLNNIILAADTTPWVDVANHNFTHGPTSADRAAGRGAFTQSLINSPTNTVSYPDIGAAQAASTNAAVSGGSWTFSQ